MSAVLEWEGEPDLDRLRLAYELRGTEPARALEEFKYLAGIGSVNSMVYLGEIFRDGIGTPVDIDESEKWFEKAWASGNISGLLHLGGLYLGKEQYEKAENVFKMAADRNYPPGIYWLARIYLRGPERFRDQKAGIDLLERASSLGHVHAKRDLSKYLLHGSSGILGRIRGLGFRVILFFDVFRIALHDPASQKLKRDGIY
jgi:TPR repeat protein